MRRYFFFGGYMSKSKVAGTIVASDGKGKVEVTKSSTITGGTPVNNLEKATSIKMDKSITGIMGKLGGSLASSVLNRLGQEYSKNNYDPIALYKSVKTLGNDFTKNLDSLGGKVLTNVLVNSGFLGDPSEIVNGLLGASKDKPLSDMIKYQKDQIKVIVNGAEQVIKDIKDFDVESVGSVITMINGIVGDDNLAMALDLASEFAMLRELNNSALALGIAGTIDCILDYKTDKKEQRLIILDGLPMAVRMADLTYVKKSVEICGLGAVWSRCPDIITELLSTYKFKEEQTTPSVVTTEELITTLDALAYRWEYSKGVGREKINLNIFNTISSDARSSLALNDRFKDAIAISGTYVSNSASAGFKYAYPYY